MRGCVVLVLALLVSSARADDVAPVPGIPAPGPPSSVAPDAASMQPEDEFGPLLLIEAIEIRGNKSTQEEIIRRALPIQPGDVLHASDKRLRNARFKVLALGFFREVNFSMKKGTERGNVIIEIEVVERGTFVLHKLWFGRTPLTPYWAGVDFAERNLLGLGISIGGAAFYGVHGSVAGARDQWAGELRISDGSLRGSRWGAQGALTLVHGSEVYRVAGESDDLVNFRAFPYRRFGARLGATYDLTALARLSATLRLESIDAELPVAPTRTLPDGTITNVDLFLEPGESRIVTAGLGFDRDTRSDPILPHSGSRITAAFEVGTSAIVSDYDFATLFARFEHWWPFLSERHAIGMYLSGGVVVGNAPRFDRIYVSDFNRMLAPRPLGMVLSTAGPINFLGTAKNKESYGELGGIAAIEYTTRLFRGVGKKRVFGGDLFVSTGMWALAQTADFQVRDTSFWHALPADLYVNAGLRVDTDLGIFEFSFANILGRLR
ncbi:MAG: BamA/TamA family outer membrane protein [Kofleriaceae bacterium]|nr:BamA/TamA family outer membrane protein [Kofleriaceae bacterium]